MALSLVIFLLLFARSARVCAPATLAYLLSRGVAGGGGVSASSERTDFCFRVKMGHVEMMRWHFGRLMGDVEESDGSDRPLMEGRNVRLVELDNEWRQGQMMPGVKTRKRA